MKRLVLVGALLAIAGLLGSAQAQDKGREKAKAKADEKANPTGTWKWTVDIGGQELERVLKLKLDGDKLTGTLAGTMTEEAKIEDPKYKDGEVSFKVQRDFGGNKFTLVYKAKVSGDSLKGATEIDPGGGAEKITREFEAKRVKEEEKEK